MKKNNQNIGDSNNKVSNISVDNRVSKFKKDDVLKYFKNYYKVHKRSPKSKEKTHPFSDKLVSKYFGSWTKALLTAELPLYRHAKVSVSCTNCGKIYTKGYFETQRYKNHFCHHSCCAIYSNKRRTSGFRVSKLELFLQEHLVKGVHSSFEFSFNNRHVCDGYELDIFIPSLQLGFEINGIFHYKPIFGQDKLDNIVRKDIIKNKLCKDKNVTLITVKDTSMKFSIKYGNIVLEQINRDIDHYIHKQKYDVVLTELISSAYQF